MGVIKRQGIKQSIVTYLGVVFGAINTLFIYPRMLPADYGLIRFIVDLSTLIFPMILLGFNQVSVRFFPDFKDDEKGHNGFQFFMITGVTTGILIFICLVGIFKEQIYGIYESKGTVYLENLIFVMPMAILAAYSFIFTTFSINHKRIAIPQIFNQLYMKMGLPILAILYLMEYISLQMILWGLVGIYAAALISNISYVKLLGQLHLKPNFSRLKDQAYLKEIFVFGGFGILGSIGTIIAWRIDVFMLGSLDFVDTATINNLESVAVYSIAIFLAGVISIPTNAINTIVQPIVAQAWKEQDTDQIQELYSKASLNLLIAGVFILILIWANIDSLYTFMKNGDTYKLGKYAFLCVGISRLFDMATSINTQIIGFSKFFRFNFYAILILSVLNIAANFLLIPSMQINGAAIATMSSLMLFNVMKFGFIWWKMGMQPFTWRILWILGIGALAYFIGTNIPTVGNFFVDIFLKSLVILFVYLVLILGIKVSPDVNQLFFQLINKLHSKIK